MRAADILAKSLVSAGTDVIFALSGNQIMPIFDACFGADIRLLHVRHEGAAPYMADAYAQVTGKVGVAMVTAGPGFANSLSPLYSAFRAESPVVLISGDSPLKADGRGAFQEMDQVAMSRPVTKHSFRATRPEDIGHDIAEAFRIAQSGRPGPVHLAIPFDLINMDVADPVIPDAARFAPAMAFPDPQGIAAIRAAIDAAEHPVIITGPMLNASRDDGSLDRLAAALSVPALAMESPRGLSDPSQGAIGDALRGADLIIGLGKTIDFTIGFAAAPGINPASKWIIADPDPVEISRARQALGERLLMDLQADIRPVIAALTVSQGKGRDRSAWRKDVAGLVAQRSEPPQATGKRILPTEICAAVQALLDNADDPILVVDGGEFGQWAQAWISAPTRVINGSSGAIGGALCYAVAVKVARPKASVVVLMGDGTSGFHFAEFETAARYGTDFIAVIGNDAKWNAEYQIQLRDYGAERLYECELNETRYDEAAAGFGCHGAYVSTAADLPAVLKAAAASGKPSCINVEMEGWAAPAAPKAG